MYLYQLGDGGESGGKQSLRNSCIRLFDQKVLSSHPFFVSWKEMGSLFSTLI